MKQLSVLFVAAMVCVSAAHAAEIGETVIVIKETTIKREGVEVEKVWLGQDLKIEAVNNDLIWVNSDHPGWINRQNVEGLDRAFELFTELIAQNPNDARYINARGNTRLQIRQRDRTPIVVRTPESDEVTADFDTAIRMQPNALFYRNRAKSQFFNQADAIRYLDEAIRLLPDAGAYADRGAMKKMKGEGGDEDFDESIRLDPTSIRPYMNRARILEANLMTGSRFDDWSEVIRLDPYNDEAYVGRGKTWLRKGDRPRALLDFAKAIEINPRNAQAFEQRGFVNSRIGQFEQAIKDYDAAMALGAARYVLNRERASVWIQLGEYDKAIEDYSNSIKAWPSSPSIFRRRGECRRLKGEFEEAIADLEQAIKLAEQTQFERDEVFFTYGSLAWLYATCPDEKFRDGQKSLELAKKACSLNGGGTPYDLDTLAAANAEVGDFDEAIKFQSQAIQAAPESKKEAYKARLELYTNRKPFRDEVKKKL
jgi:tetratricopeptide (TPR) repeat protein